MSTPTVECELCEVCRSEVHMMGVSSLHQDARDPYIRVDTMGPKLAFAVYGVMYTVYMRGV
jgi:hypothetical protein